MRSEIFIRSSHFSSQGETESLMEIPSDGFFTQVKAADVAKACGLRCCLHSRHTRGGVRRQQDGRLAAVSSVGLRGLYCGLRDRGGRTAAANAFVEHAENPLFKRITFT